MSSFPSSSLPVPCRVTEGGGFHTPVRGTMFVRNGAVTPGPSRECDITFFVKGRPKSARQSRDSTVAARRVQSVTVPSSRVSRECRSPGLRSPPLKNARASQGPSEHPEVPAKAQSKVCRMKKELCQGMVRAKEETLFVISIIRRMGSPDILEISVWKTRRL